MKFMFSTVYRVTQKDSYVRPYTSMWTPVVARQISKRYSSSCHVFISIIDLRGLLENDSRTRSTVSSVTCCLGCFPDTSTFQGHCCHMRMRDYIFLLFMYFYWKSLCILIVVYVCAFLLFVHLFLLLSMYSYCSSMYSYRCLCILIVVHVFLDAATLTEVFPCFFLGCKANARV